MVRVPFTMTIPDLDFATADTLYATHGLHAFAAKCPPQLVRWAIESYCTPGGIVLDPMCGSGTTLVEARLAGCHGYGADIDPLSRLLSRVKATPIEPMMLAEYCSKVVAKFEKVRAEWKSTYGDRLPCSPPEIPNFEKWFSPPVATDLLLLRNTIRKASVPGDVRRFLLLAFSSLITAKHSVANVRDLVHSRHHYYEHPQPPSVPELFRKRLARMQKGMAAFWEMLPENHETLVTRIVGRDARRLNLKPSSVDLICSSPPYVNALDYPRAHRFSVAWLAEDLGVKSLSQYVQLGRKYIGTQAPQTTLPRDFAVRLIPDLADSLAALQDLGRHATHRVVLAYFADMWRVLKEFNRVLRPGGYVVLVISPSRLHRVEIPTHRILAEMAELVSKPGGVLRTEAIHHRVIADNRRLLPYQRETFGDRMRSEFVVVIRKG